MTFLQFFHSLLSQGIIPEKADFHAFVWNMNGHGSGKDICILDALFVDPILESTNIKKVELCSMQYEFIMELIEGKWKLTKEWVRPEY